MQKTPDVAMLTALLDALADNSAGYAYVAEESDGFGLYAHSEFQAFERGRLAALLAKRMKASGLPRTSPADTTDRSVVNLRIAMAHGDTAVIGQLQRNDASLSHLIQASLVAVGLSGALAGTVRTIGSAICDAQAELSILSHRTGVAPAVDARTYTHAA